MKQLRMQAVALLAGLAIASTAFAGGHGRNPDADEGGSPGNSGNAPGHNGGGNGNGHGGGSGNAPGHGGTQPAGGNHGHGPRLNPHHLDLCPGSDATLVGPVGQSGQSQVAHVEFSVAGADETSDDDTSPWARMSYFWVGSSFDFIFNAHNLTPASEYTLMVAADDGSAVCLASGTVNGGGQLHLMGSVDPDASFPQGLDPFAPRTDDTVDATAKLVPSASVDCDAGTASAPADGDVVLTSEEGIRFVDVDVLECPTE